MPIKAAFPVILDSMKLWWKDWANQVLVSLVAILLSLTVVLYPMVLFGVYEQALDLTHGIRTGIIGFWHGVQALLAQESALGIAEPAGSGVIKFKHLVLSKY